MTNTNTQFTEAELEDARYEIWLASGGPAKAQNKHAVLAQESIDNDLGPNGWKVLDEDMTKTSGHDFAITELVVRRGNELKLIHWSAFNKGWMEKLDYGWGIFRPEAR